MEKHWFSHSKTSVPNKLCLSCLCRCGEPSAFSALTLPSFPTRTGEVSQGLACLVCHPRPLRLYAHATRYPRPMLQKWGNLLPSSPVPSAGGGYTRRQRTPSLAPVSSFQGTMTARLSPSGGGDRLNISRGLLWVTPPLSWYHLTTGKGKSSYKVITIK